MIFKKSLHPCALNESSLSIGRVRRCLLSGRCVYVYILGTIIINWFNYIFHQLFIGPPRGYSDALYMKIDSKFNSGPQIPI